MNCPFCHKKIIVGTSNVKTGTKIRKWKQEGFSIRDIGKMLALDGILVSTSSIHRYLKAKDPSDNAAVRRE